jgi:uncharacterized protein (TIGR03032 family)
MSTSELVRLAFDEPEASTGFTDWLADEQLSIAVTKGNSLFLIGLRGDGSLSVVERQFGLCMGLAAVGSQSLFLATRYQVWRLENALSPGATSDAGHDRLYLPQTAWTTGTLLVRDLAATADGGVVFVNGLFSCLSTPSERLSFEPVWLPPFISGLAAEDRCHLSGVALVDTEPAFVTSASRSNTPAGWRECRGDGGVLISVPTGEPIATGLSMPSSPVLRDGRLWLCLGGSGELGVIDLADGRLTRVAELPGFARGLALHGRHAIVGLSEARRGEGFDGLPLAARLRGADARGNCGIFMVALDSGRVEHSLTFRGGSSEIQGVAVLPGVRSASAVEFTGEDVQELVTVPELSADAPRR